ncbi:MAG: DivIVA domain-containing protein [Actinobacteria bacterium]|nr:DivIVA domain-containing protein [Actinomycetota bacterium]
MKPSDIEQKTFSTALRGYDLNEVDDFLDDVIATIRDLEEQVAAAKAGKGDAAGTTAPAAAPDESAVGRALIAAQNTADQILAEAREEADRIKEEARGEAETWINERDLKKAEAEQAIAELRLRVDNVRRELAVLATVVADGLDEMDVSIDGAARSTSRIADTETSEPVDTEETSEESEPGTVDSADSEDGESSGDSADSPGNMGGDLTTGETEEEGHQAGPVETEDEMVPRRDEEVDTEHDEGIIVEVDDTEAPVRAE